MRSKAVTKDFYLNHLNFKMLGEFDAYLIVGSDNIEIHFLNLRSLIRKIIMVKYIFEQMKSINFINLILAETYLYIQMEIYNASHGGKRICFT